MAHKKGGGSSVNGRNSHGQRLGVKRFGGQLVTGGNILIRQRGTAISPAERRAGKDDTLFALIAGVVLFEDKGRPGRFISVLPAKKPPLATPPAARSKLTANSFQNAARETPCGLCVF